MTSILLNPQISQWLRGTERGRGRVAATISQLLHAFLSWIINRNKLGEFCEV